MRKTFVMRGKTETNTTEVLNFGKYKQGYGYRMTEFILYPSTGIGSNNDEMMGTVTAGKTAVDPSIPDFNNDGLIAVAQSSANASPAYPAFDRSVINDTYIITQNLILMVQNVNASTPVNWQCRFESVKMTGAEEAAVNYKQFAISDE